MPTICSHTIVRNGEPFIGPVLEQVIPFVDRCLVTLSVRSNDGTLKTLFDLKSKYPGKIQLMYENVSEPKDLTKERQKQIDMTTEDWILFLDDDDYWFPDDIKSIRSETKKDVDGFSTNPYQVIDYEHYDINCRKKYFLKWFRNQPGLNYKRDWPRDILYLNDKALYWKDNPRVEKHPAKYLHLSYLKDHSFRKEKWAHNFAFTPRLKAIIPKEYRLDILK
jgi:glycosyltransferase involved in cell wall biosynthesis